VVMVMVLGLAWVGWYWQQPRTPRALFEARCSACHLLPVTELCRYPPAQRPAIVDTMRKTQGADAEINPAEAQLIRNYLKESLLCPSS